MVNIPKNDYKPDQTLRNDMVQDLCNAFLAGKLWYTHLNDVYCHCRLYKRQTSVGVYYMFKVENEDGVKFSEREMHAAFKALRNAGYHMFKCGYYLSEKHYMCSKKDYMVDGTEVEDFEERWT